MPDVWSKSRQPTYRRNEIIEQFKEDKAPPAALLDDVFLLEGEGDLLRNHPEMRDNVRGNYRKILGAQDILEKYLGYKDIPPTVVPFVGSSDPSLGGIYYPYGSANKPQAIISEVFYPEAAEQIRLPIRKEIGDHTAVHEMLHSVGAGHSDDRDSIMFPTLGNGPINFDFATKHGGLTEEEYYGNMARSMWEPRPSDHFGLQVNRDFSKPWKKWYRSDDPDDVIEGVRNYWKMMKFPKHPDD